ncbi:phosphatidylinositol N-acetylglucosaminyltransferase [Aspergillus nomiae NRRL 13137]|uniref:Phosphatidylinositol N-acetylglucosaminyltransferase n=1 Tax=Aspergillus nomiae NRRL (strain ATCC 15546 / NRRL 13137 / CBS 260.88 / M93) TaxID=1509407 RepID=A0A0L1J2L5_ASPN3|nr:phosphatidylinositol N-acetylglucosaminyltransferase [Aspergillus nomiae NRRL 13137]KNG85673.1 phosphatidylinositol N-acetylglucosaminyltransferase [Aspergillus nomiae NRRL 13137]
MAGRLILRRPSPTTVSFTVSNASRQTSTPAKILYYLQVLLRALVFVCVVFFNIARLRHSFFNQDGFLVRWNTIWSSPLGSLVSRSVDSYSSWVVVLVSAIIIYGVFRKGYTEESLLVIRGLGIQTSTSSLTYLSKASTRFIPTTQIQDIVIHEAFKGFEVRFYLAIIVDGEPEVVVVFPKLLPNRAILEEVWRGSRHCLYDSKS